MVNAQSANIFACLSVLPSGSYIQLDSSIFSFCPQGQNPYLLSASVLTDSSLPSIQTLDQDFDLQRAGGLIGFGFGFVVFCFLLGLKGSVLIKAIWPNRY